MLGPTRRQALAALVVALSVLAGCASLKYTDPGPNPARLTVPVKGKVEQAQVDEVIDRFGGPLFLNTAPRYHTISGPYWDVQAFILAPDGGLHQLPPAPGGAILDHVGLQVEGQAQFLMPPGNHQLRLILSASLLHVFYVEWGRVDEYIYLQTQYALPRVELGPGQGQVLEDLRDPR